MNHLRITDPKKRIPFQLEKNENGSYTLTTTPNKKVGAELELQFKRLKGVNLKIKQGTAGLSVELTKDQLKKLMDRANEDYKNKKEQSEERVSLLIN